MVYKPEREIKKEWYRRTWVQVLIHAAVWTLFFSLPSLLRSYDKGPQDAHFHNKGFKWLGIVTNGLWVVVFYLNAYVLTPAFINRKRYLSYAGLQVLTFIVLGCIHWLCFQWLIKDDFFHFSGFLSFSIFPFLLMVSAGTVYQMLRDRARIERLKELKEKENLTTELSFLRSQISPHFMFNVLNNMVALVRLKSDELEPTIFRLSGLMRYMLYEADEERVPLSREVEYLQNYIDLQRQRIGSKVRLNVDMQLPPGPCDIAPMLLIPFIENAFKHGTGYIEQAFIDILLDVQGDVLYFTVRNRYNPASKEIKDKTSGIGLVNVRRRLNLLYGDEHTLVITDADNLFTVSLQLNLSHAAVYSR
ncbi:sensor histidine kinase [Deminuibacter soli]|uniref:Histidine kinase n=1 Tax=Deminuibacter soli TaxID=2291815 RepID=A0A3E1NJY3_9BACT|nr:histidine kinase [Deminuibacter soli]RFM28240.1 histidine kinase [Deminuibacter soli]